MLDVVSAVLVGTFWLFIALYSLIVFVDPGFYYLSDPARVISHEAFNGIQLLLVTFVRSGQAENAGCEGDSGIGAVGVAAQRSEERRVGQVRIGWWFVWRVRI